MGISSVTPSYFRKYIFKAAGLRIGKNTIITKGFYVDKPLNLTTCK